MQLSPSGRGTRTPWFLYTALTLAVWGLFALDRGLWHDDVQNLFRALAAPGRGEGLFPVLASPTRKLLAWPFFLALGSGRPRLLLELLAGLSWLATGVLAERLALRLWPGQRRAALLAGVLTLTATPDFFTNALVAVGYELSIVAFLLAAWAGFGWLQDGGGHRLVVALAALLASLWTTDTAAPAWLLMPALWWAGPAGHGTRSRWRSLLGLWYAVALPYVAALVAQLQAPRSYFHVALLPLSWSERARRLLALLGWNFAPWGWAGARPMWQPSAGSVIPLALQAALAACAGLGAAAWAFGARRVEVETRPATRARGVLAALLLMAASNAPFAGVHLAESFCRTHLLSRVWASLALGGLIDLAFSRCAGVRPMRLALGGVTAAWIALGVAGGLERQDYYAAYARRHRHELRSILAAVPALAPDAHLLLRVRRSDAYLATGAGYLARAWAALLYQDPGVECRVFLWSTPRGTACAARADGLECRGERSPDCRRADGQDFELLRYDRLVFVDYVSEENRYVLRARLPAEAGADPRYAPAANVVERPPTPLARDLVFGPEGPAALLWPARE